MIFIMFDEIEKNKNWKKEAVSLFQYLLELEREKRISIEKKFKEFQKKITHEKEKIIRDSIFNNFTNELYKENNDDNILSFNLAFLLLIKKAVVQFKNEYEELISSIHHLEDLKKITLNEEIVHFIEKSIEENKTKLENIFSKYEHRANLIYTTETFRSVNAQRFEYFKKIGYLYKTTYMIDDHRTGKDSRYFNSLKQIRKMDENFEYVWEGKKRVFPYGPDRPNDRSILIPYFY